MGLLIALFSLSALIWVVPLLRRGRVIPLAMIVVVIGIVFGPLFYTFDGPVQISLDRIALVALMGLLAVRWRMGELTLAQPTRLDWIVVGITGWFLLRAIGTESGEGISIWLAYVAMPTAIYAVTRSVRVSDREIHWVINGFIVLGCYLAVTGLLEVLNLHAFVFPRHIVDPNYLHFLGRARGPLLSPVGNGILMTMAFVACILKGIYGDRRDKVFFGFVSLVLLAGIYATLTRSVWIGAFLALVLISLVHAPRWIRVLGLATSVLLAGGVVTGFGDSLMQLKRDKHVKASDSKKSVQLRPVLAVVAYEMFKDRPIVGHGFRDYMETSGPYHSIRGYEMPLDEVRGYIQHNVLLAVLVDTGLIGLWLFMVWLTMISMKGWAMARTISQSPAPRMLGMILVTMIATYFFNGMFHDVSIMPMVHMVMFFVAGLAATASVSERRVTYPNRSSAALSMA